MARAFGKVILLGEHAVVYGVPALALGLDRGARAEATPSERARIDIGEHGAEVGDGSELGRALAALLEALGAGPHAVRVELELPPGSGLGASAALGVATARAVLDSLGVTHDSVEGAERVSRAADAWERVYHGNPSGIDTAAAASPGCLLYTRGEGVERVRVGRAMPLVIALAGPPASTRSMVDSVARLRSRRPEIVNKAFEGIRALVTNARLCIEAGDLPGLGKLMDLNQMLLSGLMVSTEGIENACEIARSAGALGAKLTGAGGGGAVVALADLDPEPLIRAFTAAQITCFSALVPASEPGP
jgi:mevalonate kinase